MKNKLIHLSIFIISVIACLFLFNTTSYAGYQSLENLTYEVQLNEDGTADVVETWDIYVSSTNTLFKTFELDSSKFGEITNVTVKEISTSGNVSEFIETDEYAYHVDRGYYYALQTDTDEFEIAWGVSINTSANRTYQISYTITDAIKIYNDCSEFYWQFVGDTNGIPAYEVKGTIKLPSSVSTKENLKVWAHGPLNGEIQIVDNQTVSFTVSYLETGTMLEARVVTTENIFTECTNVVNRYELENIIEEETAWADEANDERDRLTREQEREDAVLKMIGIAAVVLALAIVIFFVVKIVKYVRELLAIEKVEPEQKLKYFRDIPDESATPAEASYLYYFDKKSYFKNNLSNIVSATILNLSLKKAVIFEKDEKNKINIIINKNIDRANFKEDELSIYDLLGKVKDYKNKKNKDEEKQDKISMKDIEKYAKINDVTFLSAVEGIEKTAKANQEIKGNYDESDMKISRKWSNKKTIYIIVTILAISFSAFIIPLIAVIPSLICIFLCSKLEKKTRTLTQKGVNEQEKWKALKRFMEDFSLLDEREVPELVMWEKYLVYATAFGIADKVLKQLKVKYPELTDETYMLSSGYTYIYMMNNHNLNRILRSSMQDAYRAGVRERAARQAATSSSYSSGGGGGGGFSGGGGRRRRPEAGMGGR